MGTLFKNREKISEQIQQYYFPISKKEGQLILQHIQRRIVFAYFLRENYPQSELIKDFFSPQLQTRELEALETFNDQVFPIFLLEGFENYMIPYLFGNSVLEEITPCWLSLINHFYREEELPYFLEEEILTVSALDKDQFPQGWMEKLKTIDSKDIPIEVRNSFEIFNGYSEFEEIENSFLFTDDHLHYLLFEDEMENYSFYFHTWTIDNACFLRELWNHTKAGLNAMIDINQKRLDYLEELC